MNKKSNSVRLSLWMNRAVMLIVLALIPAMPVLLRWYNKVRIMKEDQNWAMLAAFYCCVPVVMYALWNLERLLGNIRKELVFVWENVSRIRRVCLCCALVSGICFPAAFYYPPLIFLTVIMAFLCPVVNVVCQVVKAAILIREENELTI